MKRTLTIVLGVLAGLAALAATLYWLAYFLTASGKKIEVLSKIPFLKKPTEGQEWCEEGL